MTTKLTHLAPNSSGLPIDPRTGKPFTSVSAHAAYQAGEHMRGAMNRAVHHLTRGKRKAR